MECTESLTLEPQTGQGSAQAAKPKDEPQTKFTDDEQALAKHLKIKPELLRVLSKLSTLDINSPAEDLSMFSDLMPGKPGQATEPKENERCQEIRRHNCIIDVLQVVGQYPVECRPGILSIASDKAKKSKEAAERLADMEQEVCRVIDSLLDSKSKASIAFLSELSGLSGISNAGSDYATNILHSAYGREHIEQAGKEFPDDSNVAFLSMAFGLVRSATEAENEGKLSYLSTTDETRNVD